MQVRGTLVARVAVSAPGLLDVLAAQAPVSPIDLHINAAKPAAGRDYRAS